MVLTTIIKLQRFMLGRKYLLPSSILLSGISNLLGIMPYVYMWLIMRALLSESASFAEENISTYAIMALTTAVLSVLVYFASLAISHLVAFKVESGIRKISMDKIMKKPLGFFTDNTSGKVRKIIDDNASITHDFIAHKIPDLISTIITPAIILILMLGIDWRLGLACFLPIIFSFGVMIFMMGKKGQPVMTMYMDALEDMNTEAVEYVRGIPVVKMFQQTIYSFKNFNKSIISYKKMVTNYAKMWKKPMSLNIVLLNSFVFFLVPISIIIINNGGDRLATVVNLLLYSLVTPILAQSIMKSMQLNQALGQANEAVDRINNLLEAGSLSYKQGDQVIKDYDIEFKNVSFSYPGTDKKALDRVSFKVDVGKKVALVGASGSGKSTIAKMIPRFWDADRGEILIGGCPVKDISSQDLMNNISFVFQNTKLFKMSLLDNLRYGNKSATTEEIDRAIDLSQSRSIIDRLPNGLNTRIGTEGTYLSGGEQQRIALARSILKDSPIVILDEATASADPENEKLIKKALDQLTQGKTTITIAHRLTTISDADEILVIDKGKLVERGSHHKLLEAGGLYSGMWKEYQSSLNWTIKEGD